MDVFIDDLFLATLVRDLPRAAAALPFVVHLFGRPLGTDESLQRDDPLSLTKFIAEATPAECKIILGWDIDTRRLLICLPTLKFNEWTLQVTQISKQADATPKPLETLIGRLNHAANIIPLSRHFLGRIRATQLAAATHGHKPFRLSHQILADLKLWLKLLAVAHQGISLNLLVPRHSTITFITDACTHGIGGYCPTTG